MTVEQAITDLRLIAVGWSTEDRRKALDEAVVRWKGPSHDRRDQRDQDIYNQGARQGFVLGAEWWGLTHVSELGSMSLPMTPDTHCFREESQTERCDDCGWLAQAHTGCDCEETV